MASMLHNGFVLELDQLEALVTVGPNRAIINLCNIESNFTYPRVCNFQCSSTTLICFHPKTKTSATFSSPHCKPSHSGSAFNGGKIWVDVEEICKDLSSLSFQSEFGEHKCCKALTSKDKY